MTEPSLAKVIFWFTDDAASSEAMDCFRVKV